MICLVTGPNNEKRLIRGKSNKAAIDFVTKDSYTSKAVGAEEVVDLMAQGLKVEDIPDDAEDKVVSAEESDKPANADANAEQPVAEKPAGASFNG